MGRDLDIKAYVANRYTQNFHPKQSSPWHTLSKAFSK